MLRINFRYVVGGILLLLAIFLVREIYFAKTDARPEFIDVQKAALQTYGGEEVEISDYKDNVLVVYSWASWCSYCAEGLKVLSQLSAEYGNKVQFVAVNRGESQVEAKAFTDALGLNGAVHLLLDSTDAYYKENGGYAMPEILFITTRGKIALHQRGPLTAVEMKQKIEDMFR